MDDGTNDFEELAFVVGSVERDVVGVSEFDDAWSARVARLLDGIVVGEDGANIVSLGKQGIENGRDGSGKALSELLIAEVDNVRHLTRDPCCQRSQFGSQRWVRYRCGG